MYVLYVCMNVRMHVYVGKVSGCIIRGNGFGFVDAFHLAGYP